MTKTLTLKRHYPILNALSAHQEVGRGNPIYKGYQKPLSIVVFFCHSKITAVSIRLNSVMAGLLGNSKELPFLCTVFPPLANPAAYVVENISSGLNPQYKGHTAMNTSTGENRPKSNQTNQQTQIQDLLNLAIQELSNIEKLSTYCTGSAIGYGLQINEIFQHSQKALNILHDLKKLQA